MASRNSKRNPPKSGRGRRRAGNQQAGGRFGTRSGERGARLVPLSKNALFGQGFPDESHVTLKWGFASSVATSASFATSPLAANDVRDPGISSAATGAMGYAGYIANYLVFYVLASRIRIRATHGSSSSGVGSTAVSTTVCVFPSAGGTSANDLASAEAQPGARVVAFDVGGQKILQEHCSNPQLCGMSKAQYIAYPNVWGDVNNSPTLLTEWQICVVSSCTQTGVNVELDIMLEYDVVFFRRRSLDLAFEAKLLALVMERAARESVVRAANDRKLRNGDDFDARLTAQPGADEDTGHATQPGPDEKKVLPPLALESKVEHAAAPTSQTPLGKDQVDRSRQGAPSWVLLRAPITASSAPDKAVGRRIP